MSETKPIREQMGESPETPIVIEYDGAMCREDVGDAALRLAVRAGHSGRNITIIEKDAIRAKMWELPDGASTKGVFCFSFGDDRHILRMAADGEREPGDFSGPPETYE